MSNAILDPNVFELRVCLFSGKLLRNFATDLFIFEISFVARYKYC